MGVWLFFQRHGQTRNGFSAAYLCQTPRTHTHTHTPTTTFQTPRLYSVLECVRARMFARVCVTPLHSEGQCSRCQLPHKGSFQVSPGRTRPPSPRLPQPPPPTPPPPAPPRISGLSPAEATPAFCARQSHCEQTTPPLIPRKNLRWSF